MTKKFQFKIPFENSFSKIIEFPGNMETGINTKNSFILKKNSSSIEKLPHLQSTNWNDQQVGQLIQWGERRVEKGENQFFMLNDVNKIYSFFIKNLNSFSEDHLNLLQKYILTSNEGSELTEELNHLVEKQSICISELLDDPSARKRLLVLFNLHPDTKLSLVQICSPSEPLHSSSFRSMKNKDYLNIATVRQISGSISHPRIVLLAEENGETRKLILTLSHGSASSPQLFIYAGKDELGNNCYISVYASLMEFRENEKEIEEFQGKFQDEAKEILGVAFQQASITKEKMETVEIDFKPTKPY